MSPMDGKISKEWKSEMNGQWIRELIHLDRVCVRFPELKLCA